MKTVGAKIKALRISKEWSQEELAHQLGISLPTYSKIERDITDIQYSRLEQIAKLFKITVVDLLSHGEKNASSSIQKQLDAKDQEIMKLQARVIELLDGKKKK